MDLCPDEIRHNKIIQHQQDLIQNSEELETEIEAIANTLKEVKLRLTKAHAKNQEPDPLFVGDIVRLADSNITFEEQIRGTIILINRNPNPNYYIFEQNERYPEGIIHHRTNHTLLQFETHIPLSNTTIAEIFGNKLVQTEKIHVIE